TVMLPPELFTGAPGPIVTEIVSGVELTGPLAGLNWIQLGKLVLLTVLATVDVIVKLCVGGVTPACVVNVSEVGVAVSTGCALAVSKQHTSANMSVPSPNRAFLVIFKTPPLKQDVPIRAKDVATPE